MSLLFEPLDLRGIQVRNRAWVSPMCQYSAVDGMPGDWHLVHLGARALGGAGLVMTEATAVSPEGRISPYDTGIWDDAQAERWARIAAFLREHGATAAVQLAHSGRKASSRRPWDEQQGVVPPSEGGWQPVGPSAVAFDGLAVPTPLDDAGLAQVQADFVAAARRSVEAGFQVVEVHAAHGYLLHSFLSPLANRRTDGYGGDLAGRSRLLREVVDDVRAAVDVPLLVRISATDWAEGGWDVEQSVELARDLAGRGVDLVDVSSGGAVAHQAITVGPGYQVPFAAAVRAAGVPTAAVGLITEPRQAEQVLADGHADAVLLARESLRDPNWPLRAAAALGDDVTWPVQYQRARPRVAAGAAGIR
ncbi:MAG: NADH:flavin oxidoreductase/NADH oxidase [Actinomycetota bacterium]|nr:NADH:flavin oxidoreductase/NADH oxidase [Actinomycetota bacterium]